MIDMGEAEGKRGVDKSIHTYRYIYADNLDEIAH